MMTASRGSPSPVPEGREAASARLTLLQSLLGPRDPDHRQRRRAATQAAWNAEKCFRCDQDLTTGPVLRIAVSVGRTRFGRSYIVVPTCRSCNTSNGQPATWGRAFTAQCPACQRAFVNLSGRPSQYCSPRCRQHGRRFARAQRRDNVTCHACGITFTPTRSDARFCSAACRQRSYRHRRAARFGNAPG
jgi:hypothetical protein